MRLQPLQQGNVHPGAAERVLIVFANTSREGVAIGHTRYCHGQRGEGGPDMRRERGMDVCHRNIYKTRKQTGTGQKTVRTIRCKTYANGNAKFDTR